MTETNVTPWDVKGAVDYDYLVKQFGTEIIDQDLIDRLEAVTGQPCHPWIKRNIFFAHRKLNELLDAYEKGEEIFIFSGRGPSSDMHIGHMVPFMFSKWLQDIFKCKVIIQISDDEKFYFKKMNFDDVYNLGFDNALDIIAFGFNPDTTYIYSNRDYRLDTREFETLVSEMQNLVNVNTINKIFGFDQTANIGMLKWPFYQSAAAFSQSYPLLFANPAHCLVAYAIDQDPYFRLARDLSDRMELLKPCSIMSKFLPPLKGAGKMSSSVSAESTIFLTDDFATIKNKIKKYTFSGTNGDGTLESHKERGGNINTDTCYQYLTYFELDDDKLNEITDKFVKGELTCYNIKEILTAKISELLVQHQNKKNTITSNDLKHFYNFSKLK